jgi:hypothetical protein
VPLQQSLPYSNKQPMILSGFNGGNEQHIPCRQACRCLIFRRGPVGQTRPQLQSLDARQSPAGLRSKLDKSSPRIVRVGEHDIRNSYGISKPTAKLNSVTRLDKRFILNRNEIVEEDRELYSVTSLRVSNRLDVAGNSPTGSNRYYHISALHALLKPILPEPCLDEIAGRNLQDRKEKARVPNDDRDRSGEFLPKYCRFPKCLPRCATETSFPARVDRTLLPRRTFHGSCRARVRCPRELLDTKYYPTDVTLSRSGHGMLRCEVRNCSTSQVMTGRSALIPGNR